MDVHRQCEVETCGKVRYRRYRFCRPHYRSWHLYGDPLVKKQQQWHGLSIRERFFKYVQQTPTCWLWIGSRDGNGYGRMNVHDYPELAHRLSWGLHYGAVPEELCVLHKCDNPPCVNPEHLYVGTQLDNIADMFGQGRSHRRRGREQTILTVGHIHAIRDSKDTGKRLAEHYGVSEATISQIRNFKTWRDV